MPNLKLVIFDCDGVLVDSEPITNQILVEMLDDLGLRMAMKDAFEQFAGSSMDQCLDRISRLLGRPLPDQFAAIFQARAKAALASRARAVPGVEDALDRISVPYCVASSGDHEKMRSTLGAAGLWSRFEGRIFSVTEVRHPKPAPDVFLHAASRCGALPHECVVVEDTPAGIAGAVAAGMTALGYSALTPARRLTAAGAHHVFDRMSDLPGLLQAS